MDIGHIFSVIAFVVMGLLSIPMAYPATHRDAEPQSSSVNKPTDATNQSGTAAVLSVANDQVQSMLQTEVGWPASVAPVGRGFVLSARQRTNDPILPYTQIETLYGWAAGAYTATDTVQIDQKQPG